MRFPVPCANAPALAQGFFLMWHGLPARATRNLNNSMQRSGIPCFTLLAMMWISLSLIACGETVQTFLPLSPANEIPPVTNLNATATLQLTLEITRNTSGAITNAKMFFLCPVSFPGSATIQGLHLHEGDARTNGPVRFDSGLSSSNALTFSTGEGILNREVVIDDFPALTRLLAFPAGFYANLHTQAHPSGALRGQLTRFTETLSRTVAPLILQASTYTLTTGTSAATVNLLTANTDAASVALINGQPAQFTVNAATGQFAVTIPASMRANSGVLALQMRNSNAAISSATFLNVQNSETAAAVTDAAGYGTTVAPESIAAIFGTALATQVVSASSTPLPNTLDGTTVYVNGTPAPLFFVSPGQINFQIPERTMIGSATVIIRNSLGNVSLARLNIASVSPGVFTRLANGKGAPAAVASTDNGQSFTLLMSNPDGSPVEIQVGHIAVLFGTGFRFQSGAPSATAAGVPLTPAYAGLQGQLVGLDQINLLIPETMRGKGETDLVFQFDGQAANAVRIKVR